MATFYFNAALDNDWNTLGNWWADAALTVPASGLPTTADDVVVAGVSVTTNTGESQASVATLVVNDPALASPVFGIPITVSGGATFNGAAINDAQIYGLSTFNETAHNRFGTTYEMATFNDYAWCGIGTLAGSGTFNDASYNESGLLFSDSTFNDYSYNTGFSFAQLVTFNDYAYNGVGGSLMGFTRFNGSSYNAGTVSSDAEFNDEAVNQETVTGNATFNDSSQNDDGTVTGDVTLRGNASSYGYIGNPNDSTSVINLYDSSFIVEGSTVDAALITFHNSSYGAVQNTAYFGTVSFANRTPHPIPRGINGSSILGVI